MLFFNFGCALIHFLFYITLYTYTTVQKFGLCKICSFCFYKKPIRLHLFDQKYNVT